MRYLVVMAVSAVLSFALVWLWVAAMPLAYLDPEYPSWLAKRDLLQRCDLGEIVVLGDSRAAADVIPAAMPVTTTNLAVGGGKPIEALAALTRVLACPSPPRRVILSFDPAHFMRPDLFWERSVRFGFLSATEVRAVETRARALGEPGFAAPRRADGLPAAWREALYAMRFPPLYFNSLLKNGVFLRWWQNHRALEATLAARGQYFFGTSDGSSVVAIEGHLPAFQPSPTLDWYLNRILALLEERGLEADFVAMPVNDATRREVRPEVHDRFAAYLRTYAQRYPGFHVVGEVMPHWPDRLFGDPFAHLNPGGAALFSRWLAGCLSDGAACEGLDDQPRLQAAPPSTQNEAQWGWFSATGRDASARVVPSSKRGS